MTIPRTFLGVLANTSEHFLVKDLLVTRLVKRRFSYFPQISIPQIDFTQEIRNVYKAVRPAANAIYIITPILYLI